MRVISEADEEDSFTEMFLATQHSALHLEVRDNYAVDEESDALRTWRKDGSVVETDADREWTDLVRDMTGRRVVVARLRIVSVPPGEYTRWLAENSDDNIAAGEEIRWLPRNSVQGDVPLDDWWLFDRSTVGFTTFDDDDVFTGVAVTADPAIASVCADAWDRLWPQGVDHAGFMNGEFVLQ